jgi:hypothetical protein
MSKSNGMFDTDKKLIQSCIDRDIQSCINGDNTYRDIKLFLLDARMKGYMFLVLLILQGLENNNLMEIDGKIEKIMGG